MVHIHILSREPSELAKHVTDMIILSPAGDDTSAEVQEPLKATELGSSFAQFVSLFFLQFMMRGHIVTLPDGLEQC